jgi:hypothetical protein
VRWNDTLRLCVSIRTPDLRSNMACHVLDGMMEHTSWQTEGYDGETETALYLLYLSGES